MPDGMILSLNVKSPAPLVIKAREQINQMLLASGKSNEIS
jgi:hypothetical protein